MPKARSPFPPIADYAFLSDCHVTALVAPSGAVEWLCIPRMDSASVFGAILDRGAGTFRLSPTDVSVPAARRYLPGTNVLETTWMTRTGWLIVRDALTIAPWQDAEERSQTFVRSPTDYKAQHVLLRTAECVHGSVELSLTCEPLLDYGRESPRWSYDGTGYHEASAVTDGTAPALRLTTDLRLGFEGRRAHARRTLREGDTAYVALSWGDASPPVDYSEAVDRMEGTAAYWREWLARGNFPDHPWRIYLQRSALTLKGLTYAPTGAMVAAATTSLPETPQGERNWDYRFAWIRDSTFMLWALYTLGFEQEANDFFFFVADACAESPEIQIMYGIGGERDLDETELSHLSGYGNARPVRVGNAAYRQRQHDVWGSLLDAVYLHAKSRDHLPEHVWPLLRNQVELALEHWRDPDCGIWESRGEPRHFTSSKLMCWVAADRGARLAALRDEMDCVTKWSAAAEEIHADICAHAYAADRGSFTQHYETTALDASLLLMPLLRFLPPDDPRIRGTVLAIAEDLTEDGLVLRYRTDETDDGLSGTEGTFTICSFWLVSALAEVGEIAAARDLCEKLLSYASELRLYAEELDPRSGRHLGNFPQAFTHLALINAVTHVIQADEESDLARFVPALWR
jgi:GH15 family glucan-1,4-alpha-glucosidase